MKVFNRSHPATSCALMFCICQTYSSADAQIATEQPTEAPGAGLEEITVTAQRKSENLQSVPIAVSAATSAKLAEMGVETLSELGKIAPGLSLSTQTGATTIYMRGVGNNNNSAGQEQNIAIYVDGVYYPSMTADLGSFANIDRIEVLKGPQGTLFGRNTTGGLIQVVTRDPTQQFRADASLGYASYRTVSSHDYLSGGILPNLAADLAFNIVHQGQGWGRNVNTGTEANLSRSWDLRSKWVYTPSDWTKVTFSFAQSNAISDAGLQFNAYRTTPASPAYGGAVRRGFYDTEVDAPTSSTVKQISPNLKIELELAPFKFTSLSAYQRTDRHTLLDLDFTPAPRVSADYPAIDSSFSQEFQLASKPDAPFSWIGGAQYFTETSKENPLNVLVGGNISAAAYDYKQKSTSYSAFGQATFPIVSKLNLTLGGRVTYDKKELKDSTLTVLDFTSFKYFAIPGYGDKHWTNFSYKASFDYHFTDEIMGYAGISTGFKSGLYNSLFNPGLNQPVKPERLRDYEIGLKSELFGRRARLNVSSFYYDYRDVQYQSFVGNASVLNNAPAAKVYGGELELNVVITSSLSVNAGISALHTEFTKHFLAITNPPGPDGAGVTGGVDAYGKALQRSPSFTSDLSVDYTIPTSIGNVTANATYYHSAGFFWETDNRLRQEAYNLVNASLLWASLDKTYDVRLWGKNIFGAKYATFGVSGGGSVESFTPAPPATYGVTVGVHF